MLIVSGALPDGTSVYEEVISPARMIELFQIPHMGRYAEFRIDERFTKKDPDTGEIRVGRGQSFTPVYTLATDKGTVTVRYADSREPTGPGTYQYRLSGSGGMSNKMDDFRGEAMVFTQPSDIEKFIWYFLHPLNGTNPYKKRGGQMRYNFLDRETEARKKLALQTAIETIKSEIMEKEETTLRVIASGLSYKKDSIERQIPNLDTVSISQLRLSLLDRLNADGDAFVQAWRMGNNSLYGMITFAVDSGLIKVQRFQGGAMWVWNMDSHKNAPIASISAAEPEMATLKRVFNDNYNNLVPILQSAINQLRIKEIELPEATLASDEELTMDVLFQKGWDWIVSQAVLKGLIAFDYASGFIRTVTDGQLNDNLYQPNNSASWKEEITARLNTPEGAPLRLPVANAVLASFKATAGAQLTALDFLGKKKKVEPAPVVVAPKVAAPVPVEDEMTFDPEPGMEMEFESETVDQ